MGEIIFGKNNPNLNQSLFKGVRILEFKMPKIKKIIEIIMDHKRNSLPSINGNKAIIKKNIKKTIPKLLLV